MVRNTMVQIEKVKVDNRYDIYSHNMVDIYNASNGDWCKVMSLTFRFGYMQGVKAMKAQMRKGGACK